MKKIKLIIFIAIVQFIFTGCSYVSDMVEGAITERASFSIDAVNNGSNIIITWSKTDLSAPDGFAGIEIYRTRYANDEYSGYITIADRWDTVSLASGTTTSYSAPIPPSGVYFYRVGFIHWDKPQAERIAPEYSGSDTESDYNSHTDIDAISGSARVQY